ncbi:MAG: hypothetical protein QNJ22_11060 [Desulfosarcinaceae bacterium]|nr:hypothetical protein [Desulfosarcinaceae bacterium]
MRIRLLGNYSQNPARMLVSQNYFLMGFDALDGIQVELCPLSARLCYRLNQRGVKGTLPIWQLSNKWLSRSAYRNADRVGRYLFDDGRRSLKVVIDAWDEGHVVDTRSLEWADICFKNNSWPTREYPKKVFPLIHGNGRLNPDKLQLLKGFRDHPKRHDLVYLSIMWTRPNNSYPHYHAILEHHTRTFETLASIECRSNLLAVIPKTYPDADVLPYLRRLDKAGVPWQRDWGEVSSEVLFEALASAEVVYLRPGNALCISWRMLDLMCMGACVAYDGQPFPNWPVPLEAGAHYIDCKCRLGPQFEPPPPDSYSIMRRTLEALLADSDKIARIRDNNLAYFEQHAAPAKVAAYILDTVRAHA